MLASGPKILTSLPGPRSRELSERLAAVECREVTDLSGGGTVFWQGARGSCVTDVDNNRFVDLLAGFGAAALGHAHPGVAAAIARQAAELPHALGDVQPAREKVELLEALARLLPGELDTTILSSSGSDAVESALKTAQIATGRPGVIAFEGAYHGLGMGALAVTHRALFREPFERSLSPHVRFAPFGEIDAVRGVLASGEIGAILIEPIQGRGGVRIAPEGFLAELRELAERAGALLIADEVYTGLGRCGRWLACQHDDVLPDVVALGKALGGGFPISACVGRREIMDAWPTSTGEAIHTSTHLGNPMGCAAARVVLETLESDDLPARADALGTRARERLHERLRENPQVREVRGRGLMIGVAVDTPERALAATRALLERGYIVLPEGERSDVLALTPALTIEDELLLAGCDALVECLA